MSETNPTSLMKESHPASYRAVSENDLRVLIPEMPLGAIVSSASTEVRTDTKHMSKDRRSRM